jgi:branched-chain amino acid transport system permease protein
MSDHSEALADQGDLYRRHFDEKQREYLKTLVCDELIAEHEAKPLGQHSEPLGRLLHYFRHAPQAGKYAIKRELRSGIFRIVVLSGVRGVAPRPVDDAAYERVEDAYHALFLKRVEGLMAS